MKGRAVLSPAHGATWEQEIRGGRDHFLNVLFADLTLTPLIPLEWIP